MLRHRLQGPGAARPQRNLCLIRSFRECTSLPIMATPCGLRLTLAPGRDDHDTADSGCYDAMAPAQASRELSGALLPASTFCWIAACVRPQRMSSASAISARLIGSACAW